MGATANFILAPHPGALENGQKVKYHSISITKSISNIFIQNFEMKDTKHIRRDFHSVDGVLPSGWDLGVLRGQKLNSVCLSVRYNISS